METFTTEQSEMQDKKTATEKLPFRPLGLVKEVLEKVGAEVSYAYEDLVFIKHNHFLLQFGKSGDILFFYANVEVGPEDSNIQYDILAKTAGARGISLIDQGMYRLTEGEGENLSLEFLPDGP